VDLQDLTSGRLAKESKLGTRTVNLQRRFAAGLPISALGGFSNKWALRINSVARFRFNGHYDHLVGERNTDHPPPFSLLYTSISSTALRRLWCLWMQIAGVDELGIGSFRESMLIQKIREVQLNGNCKETFKFFFPDCRQYKLRIQNNGYRPLVSYHFSYRGRILF
jgi:hypothetical protein